MSAEKPSPVSGNTGPSSRLIATWQARNPRERKMLLVAAAVIALSALVSIVQ
ncbi:MAG TPA: hypothetical protein PLG92_02890 [Piscinibacter sp.]|nr:hypothetical protein [Piscinibacter sp.]HNM82340.1 hypothetical protein [Rhodocyclaceae bacterium]